MPWTWSVPNQKEGKGKGGATSIHANGYVFLVTLPPIQICAVDCWTETDLSRGRLQW
jgi:hypothetical protein